MGRVSWIGIIINRTAREYASRIRHDSVLYINATTVFALHSSGVKISHFDETLSPVALFTIVGNKRARIKLQFHTYAF